MKMYKQMIFATKIKMLRNVFVKVYWSSCFLFILQTCHLLSTSCLCVFSRLLSGCCIGFTCLLLVFPPLCRLFRSVFPSFIVTQSVSWTCFLLALFLHLLTVSSYYPGQYPVKLFLLLGSYICCLSLIFLGGNFKVKKACFLLWIPA